MKAFWCLDIIFGVAIEVQPCGFGFVLRHENGCRDSGRGACTSAHDQYPMCAIELTAGATEESCRDRELLVETGFQAFSIVIEESLSRQTCAGSLSR